MTVHIAGVNGSVAAGARVGVDAVPSTLPARGGPVVLVGGAGFIGSAAARRLLEAGTPVTIVDRAAPARELLEAGARYLACDLLCDPVELPPGDLVLLAGSADPRPRWPWTLPLDLAVTTARVAHAAGARSLTLLSSVEVYGMAPAPLDEATAPALPCADEWLAGWCDTLCRLAEQPCPPWRVAAHCRSLAGLDPSGRWVYGMAKRAQELLAAAAVGDGELRVLRLANVFGDGQDRVVSRMIRSARSGRPLHVDRGTRRSFVSLADVAALVTATLPPGVYNVGAPSIELARLAAMVRALCGSSSEIVVRDAPAADSCGVVHTTALAALGISLDDLPDELARFVDAYDAERHALHPPVPIVVPPRPAHPDRVADRQQACLWSGQLKHGGRWSRELAERLEDALGLAAEHELLLTTSGTAALRLAVAAAAGAARPGDVAVAPSFTYPATIEVLEQLGYRLRFADVDLDGWTLQPASVEAACASGGVRLVVCVDTFGNPARYAALRAVCERHGAALVGDSAASIGSRTGGEAVGTQADAHAFSMSFAKVLSAGGAGGAAVLRRGARESSAVARWERSALMDELHAVAALDQLDVLHDLVARRRRIAAVYERELGGRPWAATQRVEQGDAHSYVHWVMRLRRPGLRDRLMRELARRGVGARDYFRALHRAHPHASRTSLPATQLLDRCALALPMSSELTPAQALDVAEAVEAAYATLEPRASSCLPASQSAGTAAI